MDQALRQIANLADIRQPLRQISAAAIATFRFTFMLPPVLGLIAPGLHLPARNGCQIRIDRAGLVHCTGGSRRQIFEHLSRFLRGIAKGKPPFLIVGVLTYPPGHWAGSSGRDTWSIAVNAEVSFAPTGLGAEVFPDDVQTSSPAGDPQ